MNQDSSPGTLDPYRLPRHVVPIRYDLRLEPDLTAASFAGQETITLTVHQPTSEIVLNAIELDITSAQIEGDSGPARQATITLDAVAPALPSHIHHASLARHLEADDDIPRDAQRQAPRFLSQYLQRRTWCDSQHGRDTVRSHRCPPGVSLLG